MANVYQNWKFRADIKITNPSSTEGVQASFSLPWYPGMRGNFQDIRFSDKYGNPLSFWIESKTDFQTAQVWVKLPANDAKIFLHYGNGAAVSESDGNAVFEFFDDFSDDSLDSEKWASSGTVSVSGGVCTCGSNSYIYGQGLANLPDNSEMVAVLKMPLSTGVYSRFGVVADTVTNDDPHMQLTTGSASYGTPPLTYTATSTAQQISQCDYNVGSKFNKFSFFRAGAVTGYKYNDVTQHSISSSTMSGSPSCFFKGGIGGSISVSLIFIKKFSATEQPTITLSRKRPVKSVYIDSPAETSFTLPCDGLTLRPVTPTPNDDQFPIPTITGLTLGPVTLNFRDSMHIPVGGLSLGPVSPVICDVIPLPCSGLTLQGGYTFRVNFTLPCDGLTLSALSAWSEDYTGLDLFDTVSVDISRSITDSMWQMSVKLAGRSAPSAFENINISAIDNDGTVQHIFNGVITEPDFSYANANDAVTLGAYDYGWYLSAQKVPLDMLVMDLNGSNNSWDDWIEDLLEDTGVVDWKIKSSGYHENNKQQSFNPTTSKLDAIKKICELTGFIFYVAPVNTGTEEAPIWRSGAYFVDANDIDDPDDGLDLPEPAVITWPDSTLVGIPSVSGNPEERINRVTVRGVDDDGNWFTSVEESPNVTAKEAYPREFYEESAAWDTQAKCDYRAQRLFAYFNLGSTAVQCTFKKRFDLRLWQMISFEGAGFDTRLTTMPPLRIVSIQYSQRAGDDTVQITAAPDRDMNLLQTGTTDVNNDNITDTERVIQYEMAKTPSPVIGTVLSISGNVATVETEDGRIIDVRIVQ